MGPFSKSSPWVSGGFQPGDIIRRKSGSEWASYVILGHSPAWGSAGGNYIALRRQYYDEGLFEHATEEIFPVYEYEIVDRVNG